MPLIKRYSNRKLYDSEARRYVTLEEIAAFIRQGEEIQVVDHATGKDLTSLTLMQIIFEEEKRIGELMPQVVLTRLLRTGGETLDIMRSRLLAAFDPEGQVDEEIRRRIHGLVQQGRLTPELEKDLVEKLTGGASRWEVNHVPGDSDSPTPVFSEDDLDNLRRQVDALEQELFRLKK
jgi:polyhydroxyalkanoate synthesis repressor PhaR